MQHSKVIVSTCRYRQCREALYFKEFEIQCFCVSMEIVVLCGKESFDAENDRAEDLFDIIKSAR